MTAEVDEVVVVEDGEEEEEEAVVVAFLSLLKDSESDARMGVKTAS